MEIVATMALGNASWKGCFDSVELELEVDITVPLSETLERAEAFLLYDGIVMVENVLLR